MKIAIGLLSLLVLGMGLSACSSFDPATYGSVRQQAHTPGHPTLGYQKSPSYYDSFAGRNDGNPYGN
jgi:hypothetical protein